MSYGAEAVGGVGDAIDMNGPLEVIAVVVAFALG